MRRMKLRPPWRSPADQPAYARPVLLTLAAISAVVFAWRIDKAGYHGFYAGAVAVAVSGSWVALATVVPAQDRPYIDGTTNNSAFDMVVGYNFLNRFTSVG